MMRCALALAATALLAACAGIPAPRQPAPGMAASYTTPADAAAAPAELDRWWLNFHDHQLEQLIGQALTGSADARLALARLQEAHALRDAALTQYAPQGGLQLPADARTTRNLHGDASPLEQAAGGFGRTRTLNPSFQVSWEVDLFGRAAAHRRSANADLDAALFQAYGARAAVAAEVARSLYQARNLLASIADAQASAANQQRLLDLLQRRVARGLAAQAESDRVEAGLLASQAEARHLQMQFDAARRALLVLTGRAGEPIAHLYIDAQQAEAPAAPPAVPAQLLARRPDVLEARARLDAALGQLDLSQLALLPTVSFTPSAGISIQRGAVDLRTSYWSLAGNILVPVLDRPRLLAQARAQSARTEQAVIGYERTVQTAFSEADQALLRMAADGPRMATLALAQSRAASAYAAAQRSYRLGFTDLVPVLDAETTERQARTTFTNARITALLNAVQAFQALGGGWNAAAHTDPNFAP